MPSPFPGMDPYLEAHWRDVHAGLVIYARDALQGVLPGSLRARVEESVLLETPEGMGDHPLFPDVRVVEYSSKRDTEAPPSAGVAVAEPLLVDTERGPVVETFLEIIDRESGNRVVTVIEFLSPSNKSPGPNREQYLRKQREILLLGRQPGRDRPEPIRHSHAGVSVGAHQATGPHGLHGLRSPGRRCPTRPRCTRCRFGNACRS